MGMKRFVGLLARRRQFRESGTPTRRVAGSKEPFRFSMESRGALKSTTTARPAGSRRDVRDLDIGSHRTLHAGYEAIEILKCQPRLIECNGARLIGTYA